MRSDHPAPSSASPASGGSGHVPSRSTTTSTVSYTVPGMHVTDREVTVPLVWSDESDTRTLTLFVRELVAPARRHEDLPLLVFLQGGPGGKGPRPTGPDGWVGHMLATHRVVLLDQRGTGRSSAVRGDSLTALGTPAEQAEHLTHFRADSIVADAEHVRTTVYGGRRWESLGQSYGGFITLTYLSQAPQGLSACYVTGGLPGVIRPDAHEVYRRTYPRTAVKNALFRDRFPQDADRLAAVADRISAGDVRLPDGDLLTVRRLQTLGSDFGMKHGFERVHWALDEALDPGSEDLSDTFLAHVAAETSYRANPLYAVLQEAIYASGTARPGWACEEVRAEHPGFAPDARPLLLTGEMIYPWMFEEIAALRPFRAATEELHRRTEWSPLYDLDVLAANEVPVVAAVYHDDMFVPADLSLETAEHVGNTYAWVTNEHEHDGLRVGGALRHLTEHLAATGGPLRDA
ncbi:alpha/beta fold hydrolase [Sanguibacter sp. YZGR15]|uniref:Alpha/beta fold hydrolase n=2 Tax=Sanguibacter suaedae TaxID=2795737 RepID=A0A934I1L1_9MICO|nr:alpha/beta fold hydrolase [Sanguibacter suaedae]MBI9113899.1 alpha/beta fold hydrolase [Sanguibacter suaedae]